MVFMGPLVTTNPARNEELTKAKLLWHRIGGDGRAMRDSCTRPIAHPSQALKWPASK